MHRSKTASSFDHIVCQREHIVRNFDAECFRSLDIEKQLKLCFLHNWQVRWLFTFQA
jgi:hypothetical protein